MDLILLGVFPGSDFTFAHDFCDLINELSINLEKWTIFYFYILTQRYRVKVQEGDLIQNLWISEGSYRFFHQLSYIACSPQGDGLYINSSNGELFLINALDMGYDEAVQVVVEVCSVGNNGLSVDTSGFSSLLNSKTKNIFLIIGIVIGAVIFATVIIIIIRLLCNYCPKRTVGT
jgi:hypothetical protein